MTDLIVLFGFILIFFVPIILYEKSSDGSKDFIMILWGGMSRQTKESLTGVMHVHIVSIVVKKLCRIRKATGFEERIFK